MSMLFKRARLALATPKKRVCVSLTLACEGTTVGTAVLTCGKSWQTVDFLKATVQAATGIPPAEQRLIFKLKELLNINELFLEEAGFAPGATVDVSMIRRPLVLARVLQLVLDAPRKHVRRNLREATGEARADRGIVFAAVSRDGYALQEADVKLKADREIVVAAVSKSGCALTCAAEELKADRKIVLIAVSQDGSALKFAAEELRAHRGVVLAAVEQTGCALEYATEELKADRGIVLAAVSQDGFALQFATEELKADQEIFLAVVSEPPSRLFVDRLPPTE